MAEEKDKGFRIIDRRGREESPPPAPEAKPAPQAAEGESAPQQPPGEFRDPGAKEGNRPAAAGVQEGKSRGEGPPRVGSLRFLDLVGYFQMQAIVGLGMAQTPDGQRPPANLAAAKDAIDILSLLQEKTKGNLTKEEEEILREGLYHLRMEYVALASAPPGGANKGGNRR